MRTHLAARARDYGGPNGGDWRRRRRAAPFQQRRLLDQASLRWLLAAPVQVLVGRVQLASAAATLTAAMCCGGVPCGRPTLAYLVLLCGHR